VRIPNAARAALVGALASLLLAGLLAAPSAQWLDAWAYDWLLRVRHLVGAGPRPRADIPIRIVEMDDSAAREFAYLSPVPRGYVRDVLVKLRSAEPRLIVLDILLDRPSYPGEDAGLADAIRQAGNVVLAQTVAANADPTSSGILPAFRDSALAVGAVDVALDRDNVLRRMRTAVPARPKPVPFAALVAARQLQLGPQGHGKRPVLINYAGPPGRAFPILSTQQLLQDHVDLDVLRGSVVFVGATFSAGGDSVATPLSGLPDEQQAEFGPMSGVEVLAHCLLTVLTSPIRELGWLSRAALSAGLGGLAAAIVAGLTSASARWRRLLLWLAVVAVLMAAASVAWAGLFVWRWTFCGLSPLVAVALGPLVAVADTAWRDYAAKREAAVELRARERLTATIVHDLKAPLTALRLSATALRRQAKGKPWPQEADELLHLVDRQTERLGHEVECLLDADPRRPITVMPAALDLEELAREVIAGQDNYDTQHEFAVYVARDSQRVVADRALLRRALSNLVDNAVRYSPDGGQVDIRIEGHTGFVRVSVSDRGIGMTPAQQERLFRPFSRVVEERYGIRGAGVGLFSVKRIAEAHGGSVGVESEAGKGSQFWVDLPTNDDVEGTEE
jgi:signal transduction histidine kinase